MPTRKIVCAYCGRDGEIDVWGLNEGVEASTLFRYLGHNPLSGHMHFQCPFCGVVSLISPMSVLGQGILTADHRPFPESPNLWTRLLAARGDRVTHPLCKRPLMN